MDCRIRATSQRSNRIAAVGRPLVELHTRIDRAAEGTAAARHGKGRGRIDGAAGQNVDRSVVARRRGNGAALGVSRK